MTKLTITVKDNSKLEFFLEILKRMEFLDVSWDNKPEELNVEEFLNETYESREDSGKHVSQKLDNLFSDL